MLVKQGIQWGSKNPNKLFLIDGTGALLSAFLLGVVLVKLESIFGIPPSALYVLAALPMLFCVYDIFCFRIKNINISPYLRTIAVMNVAYCFFSLGLALYHFQKITYLGWAYLLGEIAIVMLLATFEWKVAREVVVN